MADEPATVGNSDEGLPTEPSPTDESIGNLEKSHELPMQEPFIPESVGNNEIANARPKKEREATTVEPRAYANGIAIYVRAAYWIDPQRGPVMYIQSTDYERLKEYEQAIKKWFQSPNRTKPVPESALARIGIHVDGA